MSTAPEVIITTISDHTLKPHNRSRKMPSAIALRSASTQSKIMVSLMTLDQTPEPPKKASAM